MDQPERKARITLGAVVVENRDISLGQCRLSFLMAAMGQNPIALMQYHYYTRLEFLEKVDETRRRVVHSEDRVDQRIATGHEYMNFCSDYAHYVAK